MGREIKFRVMDIDGNWHYYTLGDFVCDGPIAPELNPETWTQYTGLKDAYGFEIYEGDIVSWNGAVCYIAYEESDASFMAVEQYDSWAKSGQEWSSNCKVIGNIYQNKDLLNG